MKMELIIMRDWEKCTLHNVERKGTSCYGNPSYWIYFFDSEGHFHKGYTASDASAGYTASNYRYCDAGEVIYLDYHFTKKKGTCIVDYIKHDSPNEATLEAEAEAEATRGDEDEDEDELEKCKQSKKIV